MKNYKLENRKLSFIDSRLVMIKSFHHEYKSFSNHNYIKPCPFCGQEIRVTDPDFCYPTTRKNEYGVQYYRAGCIEIAGGCGAEVIGESYEEAFDKWNRRVK